MKFACFGKETLTNSGRPPHGGRGLKFEGQALPALLRVVVPRTGDVD